jgi:hypothetical protein
MPTKTPRRAALPPSPDAADVDSNAANTTPWLTTILRGGGAATVNASGQLSNEPQRKLSRRLEVSLRLIGLRMINELFRLKGMRKLNRHIPGRPAEALTVEECEAETNELLAQWGIEGPLNEEEWGEIARAVQRLCESAELKRPKANLQGSPAPTSADRPTFFDYSNQEWSEIEKAARSARNRPPPKRLRKELVDFACDYLGARLTRSQRRQAWQKVVPQVDRLQQTISVIACGPLQQHWLSVLSDIRCGAEIAVTLSEGDPFYFKNNPKMEYEFYVLSTWRSLGGKLKISRNSGTGKIDGPLARFFRAVTVPVMGTLAPSLESLPDIVQRQKRFIASQKRTLPILLLLATSRIAAADAMAALAHIGKIALKIFSFPNVRSPGTSVYALHRVSSL